jgi:hypothetical protein
LNLALSTIELRLVSPQLLDSSPLVPVEMIARSLAEWVFAKGTESSLFAQFVTAVLCLTFTRDQAIALSGQSLAQLADKVQHYASNMPADSVAYERDRARAYRDLVDSLPTQAT